MARLGLVALFVGLLGFPVTEQRMVGLLVGMGAYRELRYWVALSGPGDARNLREVLVDRFGARPEDLEVLPSEQATRDDILAALERLHDRARPGNVALFYYSGHGCSVPDREPLDESDGRDECLVPVDAPGPRSQRFSEAVIRDDELSEWLARTAGRVGSTGEVVMIFDSCHSGTMHRAGRLLPRTLPDPDSSGDNRPLDPLPPRTVVLSACSDGELAWEDPDRGGGAFTGSLLGLLRAPDLDESW
ncbi:MAG: caspase family protein, partial [Candidatus Eremiobacterota bacterium]